LTKTKILRFH